MRAIPQQQRPRPQSFQAHKRLLRHSMQGDTGMTPPAVLHTHAAQKHMEASLPQRSTIMPACSLHRRPPMHTLTRLWAKACIEPYPDHHRYCCCLLPTTREEKIWPRTTIYVNLESARLKDSFLYCTLQHTLVCFTHACSGAKLCRRCRKKATTSHDTNTHAQSHKNTHRTTHKRSTHFMHRK